MGTVLAFEKIVEKISENPQYINEKLYQVVVALLQVSCSIFRSWDRIPPGINFATQIVASSVFT
jgi:hypothetical protein